MGKVRYAPPHFHRYVKEQGIPQAYRLWLLMSFCCLYRRLDALQLPGTEKITHRKGDRAARVKPINFPEDNLVDSFYARNADVSVPSQDIFAPCLVLFSAALL